MFFGLQRVLYKTGVWGMKAKREHCVQLTEKEIEESILNYLNLLPRCFAFKVKTTGFFDTKRRMFRKNTSKYVVPGTSDILCIYRGKFIAIEVKTPRTYKLKTPTVENQQAFIDKVVSCEGTALFVWSLDQVVRLIQTLNQQPDVF